MGSDLPVLKPKEVVKILNNHGFELVKQKGFHQSFNHIDDRVTTVLMHESSDLSPILLRQICKGIKQLTHS